MSVELEPAELGFRRPFTQEVSETLRLHNSTTEAVAFKVKTTAPKQYCVRPNSGLISPGSSVEVQVLLQAMKEDPPLEAKCRDKFLVQSVAVATDATTDASQIVRDFLSQNQQTFLRLTFEQWADLSSVAKSTVSEKKIRVNFLPADGTATPARKSLSVINDDDHTYSSPASVLGTPAAVAGVSAAASSTNSSSAPVGAVTRAENKPDGAISSREAAETASNPVTNPTVSQQVSKAASNATVSAAAVAGTSADELKAQLEAARAQIARLTTQAADQTGLRQRKPGESEKATARDPSTSQVVQAAPSGVPVPVVAALCLLAFLLAYLLF